MNGPSFCIVLAWQCGSGGSVAVAGWHVWQRTKAASVAGGSVAVAGWQLQCGSAFLNHANRSTIERVAYNHVLQGGSVAVWLFFFFF
jgi:hypothetical protein